MKLKWNGQIPIIISRKDLNNNIRINESIFEVTDEIGEKLLKIKGFEKV